MKDLGASGLDLVELGRSAGMQSHGSEVWSQVRQKVGRVGFWKSPQKLVERPGVSTHICQLIKTTRIWMRSLAVLERFYVLQRV